MKKLINNVVMLDMRTATPESIGDLTINNAVTVFVTESTKSLIGKINFGNLVQLIEIPDNITISNTNGNMVISGNSSLKENSSNVYKMINGNLIFSNNVQEELFFKIFEFGGVVNGNVTVPDHLSSTFLSSKILFNGEIKVYPTDSILYLNDLKINNGFIKGLEKNSKITVTGNVEIAGDTRPELFEDNISELTVFGNILMHEHISESFFKSAKKYSHITILPNAYALYNADITVMPSNILSFKNKKLYTRGNVIFTDDLTESQITQYNFSIKTDGIVFCPEKIAQTVFDMVITDRFQTYSGFLAKIDDSYNLTADEVEQDAVISCLVNGEMIVEEELDADLIARKVSDIFLFGEIKCSNELQKRVIYKKTKINKGDIKITSGEPEEPETVNNDSEYDIVISNAVTYAL